MKSGIVLSGLFGLAVSSGSPLGLAVSILAPVVWMSRADRTTCYVSALAYYLAAFQSLPVVTRNFFGPGSGLPDGICLWILAAGGLSLPWLWTWTPSPAASLWRCPAALLSSVLLPLGLIGWASPTSAAGLLFPGAGYAGFALTLCLPPLISNSGRLERFAIAAIIGAFHFGFMSTPQPPNDWGAIDTNFGAVGHGPTDMVREYQIGREIQLQSLRSKARVVIFPEAVAASWTADLLQSVNKTILVGSVEPTVKSLDFTAALNALRCSQRQIAPTEPTTYSNKLLVRGAQIGEFVQRVPIPIGMWRPFASSGVPLNLNGPGTLMISGQRVAVIICYE